MTKETDTRIFFEPSYSSEEGVVFAINEAGGVTVNVSEEKAMDSYNLSFTCTMSMTREQTIKLKEWLAEHIT